MLLDNLPAALAEDGFLSRFLGIFEDIHKTVAQHLDTLEFLLDPQVAPTPMLRWLVSWRGLGLEDSLSEEALRRTVGAMTSLFPLRGTRVGLEGLLSAITGGTVDIEDAAVSGVFRVGQAPREGHLVSVWIETTGDLTVEQVAAVLTAELPSESGLRPLRGRHPGGERSSTGAPACPRSLPGSESKPRDPGGGLIPNLTCPDCGSLNFVEDVHPGVFCRVCDYPLFWMEQPVAVSLAGTELEPGRRPGVGGHTSQAWEQCPTCGERNDPDATTCVWCGNLMILQPPEPPPPPPPPVPEPVVIETGAPWWLVWALAGVSAVMLIALVGILIFYF